MAVDPLSIKTYIEERDNFDQRAALIHGFSIGQQLTDREIKDGLGLRDMNDVRPRITELIKEGWMEKISEAKCPTTGKTVRVVTGLKQKKKVEQGKKHIFYAVFSDETDEGFLTSQKDRALDWLEQLESEGYRLIKTTQSTASVVNREKKTTRIENP